MHKVYLIKLMCRRCILEAFANTSVLIYQSAIWIKWKAYIYTSISARVYVNSLSSSFKTKCKTKRGFTADFNHFLTKTNKETSEMIWMIKNFMLVPNLQESISPCLRTHTHSLLVRYISCWWMSPKCRFPTDCSHADFITYPALQHGWDNVTWRMKKTF